GASELEKFLLLDNIYVSFAGNVTYTSAHTLHEALRITPKERLFLETDAPYLAPVPMRGKKNLPTYIQYTYDFVANFLTMSLDDLCRQIETNFSKVFLSSNI
ncbi:MAG: TatD family hydrolase, partial [Brevinematales bacterium]